MLWTSDIINFNRHGQRDLLEETTTSSFTGDNSKDVYAVTLKISVVREPQKMAVKISKKVCFNISTRNIKRKVEFEIWNSPSVIPLTICVDQHSIENLSLSKYMPAQLF